MGIERRALINGGLLMEPGHCDWGLLVLCERSSDALWVRWRYRRAAKGRSYSASGNTVSRLGAIRCLEIDDGPAQFEVMRYPGSAVTDV
jgi:hypothetical protein